MTLIQEDKMIFSETREKTIDHSEYFDVERFFIPGEIYIPEEKMGW